MSTVRPPFRIGIIGTGGIAHAHADAIRDLHPRAEIVGVVDLDPDRAAQFAADFGVGAIHVTADELLARGDVDLVCICTPPETHAPLAAAAARSGIASLVEKPTALSLGELDELARAEAETGAPILTVFQHRFGPAARHLRSLAESGVLGRPLVATCETLWFRPDEYFAVPWRGRWEVEGGGPTMGHGIHQFDLMLAILGDWTDVTAFAARQLRPTDTEDVSLALVRFANGALATVVNSLVSPRETSRLRFDFEYASIEVEHLYGYTSADWTFTPAPGHEHLTAAWEHPNEAGATSGHRDQLAAILDAFEHGEAPGVGLAEARRTLEFAAATYASAFRSRIVSAGELIGDDPFVAGMSGGIVPWAPVKAVLA
ncbi:Gfo/Idh/MocA family oxidoreductase [Microbacterium sp. 2FI]|uniref:Gfo/Idh/MocA family protein n=1 Tax=Microbacterium sp. 2FI TaxID=2502193 RepID=UPI0010F4FEFC|nr:Gfo/Idh/MocA family oxidoreductase [Microbacterium sp. 2FI]